MIKLVLVACLMLLATSACIPTFTAAPAPTGADIAGFQSRWEITPDHASNDITFTFTFPLNTGLSPAATFTYNVYATGAVTSPVKTSGTLTVVPGGSVTDVWTGLTVTSGTALDLVITAASTTPASLELVYIAASQNADIMTVTNAIDVLRDDKIWRYIYVKDATQTFTADNTIQLAKINAYSVDSSFKVGALVTIFAQTGTTGKVYTFAAPGYYLIQFIGATAATLKYQSDLYSCPSQLSGKTDTFGLFEACTFKTTNTETIFSDATPHAADQPLFYLPSIGLREVIEIKIQFPDLAALTSTSNTFYFEILETTGKVGTQLNGQPTQFGADGSSLAIIATGYATYHTFWTAHKAGNYYLKVVSKEATTSLLMYYLLVYRANGGILVKAVDALRQEGQVLRYLSVSSSPLTLVLEDNVDIANIKLFETTTADLLFAASPLTEQTPAPTTCKVYITTPVISKFYVALFTKATFTTTTISTMTDPYPCPYDTSFQDIRGIFKSCTGSAPAVTLPVVAVSPTPVYGDPVYHLLNLRDNRPRYYYGMVATGDHIFFMLNFSRPTGVTGNTFKLIVSDAPVSTPNIATPLSTQPPNLPISTEIPATEPFFVMMDYVVEAAQDGLHMYVDVVQLTNAQEQSFTVYDIKIVENKIGASFLNLPALGNGNGTGTDILRSAATPDFLYNLIYIHTAKDIVLRHTEGVANIQLFKLPDPFANAGTPPTTLTLIIGQVDTKAGGSSSPDTIKTFSAQPAGYYGVRVHYTTTEASASFTSDSYSCPITKALDFNTRGAFDPCGGTLAFPFPNAPINLHQAETLKAHGCGTTQFFLNGTCQNMDPTKNCNTFNALSGDCLTCPTQAFTLTGGRCVAAPSACATGSTLVGVFCVSDLCATSSTTGACASCKSAANEVKADGSCGPKACAAPLVLNASSGACEAAPSLCPAGQLAVQGNCYLNTDPNCLALSPWLTCAKCADNHRPVKGKCTSCNGPCVSCSGRQFLNAQRVCAPVSQECSGFDPATGQCTSCLSGAAPVSGVCCPAGQAVQGNACVTIGGGSTSGPGGATPISFLESPFFKHCQTVDVVKLVCTRCKAGRGFLAGTSGLCV